MKKIIAMLLCVAMIAAMGVSAFAESKLATHDYKYYWNKKVNGDTGNGYTRDYAAGLASAKKAASDAKDSATKTVKAIKDAVAVAQNYMLASYYNVAAAVIDAQVQNAITQAWVDFNYNYQKNILDITPQPIA